MRKFICLVLALSLVLTCLSSVAFAEALREDPKAKAKIPVRFDKGDIVEDFTGVETGSLPATISANSPNIYTEEYEVLPGYKKNCLVINDTTYENTYSGISANYNFGARKGKLEVTIRYKYIKPEECNYGSFIFGYYSSKGMFSRTVVASSNGSTQFNYGGPDSTALEQSTMLSDTWYTLTYVIDFENEFGEYMSARLYNEGTKATGVRTAATWYDGTGHQEIYRIALQSSMYGGKYVFDYIRVRTAPEGEDIVEIDPYANIKKGVEQIRIPAPVNDAVEGRINVTYNGSYKYTTLAPYVAENGSVMITAKNLADMFGLGYLRQGTEYTVTAGDTELVFTAGSASASSGKKTVTLKDKTTASGTQLYVPAEVICEMIGLECTYDAASQTFVINTPAAEEGGDK